uniref:Protein phosphatase 1 regulatory subunit 16A-like isoform X1 n=1 Tax=Petromyzon marinus TaxID=7757 RepID=A0AAJ7THA7_PETMA|nr:protein phosphatase 1 regulatory subunit 16A-like isoform X1 [Petromyzon marinus]XP_032816557.1 protein phosphatase 1 regulatory subunit 16A-like isoform X1 [Petromyzon marinus]
MGDIQLDRDFEEVVTAPDRSLPGPERLQRARKKRAEQLKRWAEFDRQHGKKGRAKKKRLRSKSRAVNFPPSLRLLEAVSRNDVDEVTTLLSDGVSPDSCNEEGLTALHQACLWGWEDLAGLLLSRGASVNARDSGLWTPLHAACAQGFTEVVRLLVPRGADLLALSEDGETPFDVCDDHETIAYLEGEMRQRGLTEKVVEDARKATEDSFISEMTQSVADLNAPDDHGVVVLHMAVAHGYERAVRVLLEVGARSDLPDADGWTPLHAAAYWGQENIAEILVAYGARLDTANKHGQTPVEMCEDVEMRARLARLKERAERGLLDVRNRRGFLPLHRSSLRGSKSSKLVHKGRTEEMQSEAIVWQTMEKRDDADDDAEDSRPEDGRTASRNALNGNGITHGAGAERLSKQETSGGEADPTESTAASNRPAPAGDAALAAPAAAAWGEQDSDAMCESASASDTRPSPEPEAADENSAADDDCSSDDDDDDDDDDSSGADVHSVSRDPQEVVVQQPVAQVTAAPAADSNVEDARGTDLSNGKPIECSAVSAAVKGVAESGEPPDENAKAGAAPSSQLGGPGASEESDKPPPACTNAAAASNPRGGGGGGDEDEEANAAEQGDKALCSERATASTPAERLAQKESGTASAVSAALEQNGESSDAINSVDVNGARKAVDADAEDNGVDEKPASPPKVGSLPGDGISTHGVDNSADANPPQSSPSDDAAKPQVATPSSAAATTTTATASTSSSTEAGAAIDESRVLVQLLNDAFEDDDLSSKEDGDDDVVGGAGMSGGQVAGVSYVVGGHKANGVREPRRPQWDDHDVPTFKGEVREDNTEAKGRRCCKMM